MEKEKQKYLAALKANNNRLDEFALGETLRYTEEKTAQIIKELMEEEKIEFQSFSPCSYRLKQT